MSHGEQNSLDNAPCSNDFILTPVDKTRLQALCGQCDEHLRLLESELNIVINSRGNMFHLVGEQDAIDKARNIIEELYHQSGELSELTPAKLEFLLAASANAPSANKSQLAIQGKNGLVKARTENQALYLDAIQQHDMTFGLGPAGTGKTFLAVACAVAALESQRVQRIMLVRPAVEAGEHLGFLPGDLSQKIDPYCRPLYDALYDILGQECVNKYLEKQIIEVAPLAYMRGRTLTDAFIILDEAQNTSIEQMKMFLTRMGHRSKVVVTGDASQIDLPRGQQSGLVHCLKLLDTIKEIACIEFANHDVVRHPLVQKILGAYQSAEGHDHDR